ncbi:MAG: hypothetical protein H5T41_08625 [Methanomassiliicoccales archaeon]|nr:hypothetical protein [Methanomassiliicoccales archaeon]
MGGNVWRKENIETKSTRPFGCFFDVYGYPGTMIEELTCDNCPISPMVCDYRGQTTINRLAEIISAQNNVKIISDP